MRTLTAISLAAAVLGGPALASSDDAWSAFRKEVADSCLALGAGLMDTPKAVVDPFGSEHYGLALVEGTAKGSATPVRAVCVYDKATKKAEIGGELPDDTAAQ
ncbi:MAG TPA: hypothetical protein PKA74_09455 [Bauldia sp.]|nr:hypothetical protein [Bauldia sp.]